MGARRYEIYLRDFEIEHEKINFMSPSSHVLFYLLYKFRSIITKSEYSKGFVIRISGHMCLIRYKNTCVLIRHFLVAKIPTTHCSLYNRKVHALLVYFRSRQRSMMTVAWKLYARMMDMNL